MTEAFDREVEHSVQRMQEAVSPYTRFVRSRRDELSDLRGELDGLDDRRAALGDEIERL